MYIDIPDVFLKKKKKKKKLVEQEQLEKTFCFCK